MSYASDLTDEQWVLLEPVFNAPGKRARVGPAAGGGRDALHLPHRLPVAVSARVVRAWTRVWSQFRRWSRNGTWARALTVLHKAARAAEGRAEATPSMVVIDTHLARGASNGGVTFPHPGGPPRPPRGGKRGVGAGGARP